MLILINPPPFLRPKRRNKKNQEAKVPHPRYTPSSKNSTSRNFVGVDGSRRSQVFGYRALRSTMTSHLPISDYPFSSIENLKGSDIYIKLNLMCFWLAPQSNYSSSWMSFVSSKTTGAPRFDQSLLRYHP
jgi:hypothetical protein